MITSAHHGWDACFQVYISPGFSLVYAEPGLVESLLGIELVVKHCNDYLQVTLGLHEATHDTETGVKFLISTRSSLSSHGRYDRMVWALPGSEGIGMLRV